MGDKNGTKVRWKGRGFHRRDAERDEVAEEEQEETQHKDTKAQRSEGKEMCDVLRKKDNNPLPDFSVSYPYSYSNPSRRDFTAETQRGTRSLRKNKRRLNTKTPRHKGQRGRRCVGKV